MFTSGFEKRAGFSSNLFSGIKNRLALAGKKVKNSAKSVYTSFRLRDPNSDQSKAVGKAVSEALKQGDYASVRFDDLVSKVQKKK